MSRNAPQDLGRALVVFAKHARPGRVKTRLCPPLSAPGAARLYEAFLRDTVEIARRTRAARHLAIAPWSKAAWFRRLGDDLGLLPQGRGGLGHRLSRVTEACFAQGASAVVVLGSDHPTLPSSYVEAAFERLEARAADAVFGPSEDGGYYLVGLARPLPALFRAIPFSRSDTLEATLSAAAREGARIELLPSWYDVDGPADLERLRRELLAPARACCAPWSARVLSEEEPAR